MRKLNVVMSGLALASLVIGGFPTGTYAQGGGGGGAPSAINNVQSNNGLLVTLDDTKPTALLGGESVIQGKVKNTHVSPLYNVGWTVRLPQGVEYLGATAGPSKYGSPKATILLYPGGRTETLVHWPNAADISQGESLFFEIRVKNKGPKEDEVPPKVGEGKVFTIDEKFNVDAWAQGSSTAAVLPKFGEFGTAPGLAPGGVWAIDNQEVQIKGFETKFKMDDLLNGVTLRGNKSNQRQKVTVQIDRTSAGLIELTQPVSVELDPDWEIMGTCVKDGPNCFTPSEQDVQWVGGAKPKWILNIPANKFDFDQGNTAEVTFEIAALEQANVDPGSGKKVNMAGYGGDGTEGGNRDDAARQDAAYLNNTGVKTQNKKVKITGSSTAMYTHPWADEEPQRFQHINGINVEVPEIGTQIQDTAVTLATKMIDVAAYQNEKLATKTLIVKNNEYTPLPQDRRIEITLPEQECPVVKDQETCVQEGSTIEIVRDVVNSENIASSSTVQGQVTKVQGKYIVTIQQDGIEPRTSITQTFNFKSKVLSDANGKPVVNGKSLETKADLKWTYPEGPVTVEAKATLPPAPLEVYNTVAFPTDGNGNCPAAMDVMPDANAKKLILEQPEAKRLLGDLKGKADIWGKRRKVGAGQELCFQVFMQFPEGILTSKPNLDVFLPPEAELIKTAGNNGITFSGTSVDQIELEPSSMVPLATDPVDKPEKRTPLRYTFKGNVAGGTKVSMIYKATIKNTSVVDPEKPDVIYDNLAKLSFKDFEGGYSNARDLAGYEYVNPLLMLSVDKKTETVQRGSSTVRTYQVTNVGSGPVAPETKVLIRLPEGVTCNDLTVGGGATKDSCVDGATPNGGDPLITGGYLVAKLTDAIGSKDPNSDNDQKSFTLAVKANNSHGPSLTYDIDAGILGYKGLTANPADPSTPVYIPKTNKFCKTQAAPTEETDKACTLAIGEKVFGKNTPADALGKTLFTAGNTAPGGLSTHALTQLTTGDASLLITGTSSDVNQKGSHNNIVVPGEKGSISVTVRPNQSVDAASTPSQLTWANAAGNVRLELKVSGVNGLTPAQHFKALQEIKTAATTVFGGLVSEGGITLNNTSVENGVYTITIPLNGFPGQNKVLNLPDLFVATKSNVVVEGKLHYKALNLKHRDSQNNQFNAAPVGAPRIATAPALTFNRLVPTLTVNKSVTRPTINRITGQSEIDYQIVITNTSNVTAYGVKIKDTLPDRFKHRPSLTSVTVTAGISPSDLDTKKPWSLTDSDKVGEWPVGETINIPSGGVITIAYTATSPDLVTTAQAYTNNVAVPFASQPGSPVGAETYNQAGSATVHGENILSTTTITAQNPRHTNGKVQVGELVTTTTRITIPTKVEVQNLSVLTTLSGATFDRSNATVRVTCGNAPGLNCDGITALLNSGDPTKLGVNVSDTNFQNNTGAPIEVTVEVQNLLVTGGTGPIVAVGNAYRGPTTPTSPEDITTMTKASGDSTGEVPIQTPGLNLTTALVTGHTGGDTGSPVSGPIEPGTPDLFAKIEIVNPVSGSDLRQVSADIASKLDAIGLAPANGFTHANWNNGSIKLNNLPGGDDHKFTLFVPVTWKEASFKGGSRLSGEQTTPVNATGKTGPLNSVSGALAPETEGNPVVANSNLTYTPLYPVPAVSVGITKLDGGVLSTETPPVLKVGDEAKVTFTPTITGAKGYNPVLCVKAENIDGSVGKAHALAALELLDPSSGVGVVDQKTACGSDEIEVKLPQPDDGKTLPPVSFKVASSGGAITEIMHTKITATLKVSSQIDRGTTEQPGPRDFTATTDQKVNVSPSVDIKVTSQWFKPSGEPFGDSEQVVYNDFDTESTPVKAKISIQNIGSDAATPQGSTVKVMIPTGFTIDGNPDTDGWTCKVTTGAGHDILTCERNTELPGNQAQPFIVTIKSPHGPGVRLTTNPLVIQGGHNDDRGAASPFDHNPTNDRVNTQATVRIPTPDLAPVVTMNDTILRSTSLTKPFTVTVTNNDDGVRANEARLQISTNAGGGTLEITKPNGWNCSALVGTYVCVYPNATTGSGQVLPTIEGTVTVPTEQTNSTVQVGTQWQRPGPGGIPTTPADKNPANDNSFVHLVPFNNWVDGKVTVEFKTPNPNQDQEAEPIIRIIHNDGGGSIPNDSKVKVKVPEGATVGNSNDVNNCIKTEPGTETTPATWTCDITRVPTLGGPPLEGPTVTGFTGPNQKIVVTLEYPDPKPTDPDLNNNTGTGTTAPSAPVPGPQPPKPAPKPTPIPDPSDPNAPEPDPSDIPAPKPEDRPTTIPQPPTPPASPAPANPGRTPALKEPEERANGWIESVYPAEGRAPIVLIGRDNVFADSLSSGGLQGILDAPLLLNPVSHLSDKTKATLDRLQPEQVIILGGPVAQSPAVEAELKQLGWNVSRVHGPTRVETAIDAATVHAPDATHGILARAYASDWGSGTQAFADALSGGALAARQQRPVFLTPTGELTDTLRTYLAKAKITHLTVVGSTEAVSSEVEAELHKMGITTNRISGANRAETAINVAQSLGYWHAGEAEAVLVVNGESEDAWTDAFPAALYAKRFELPVVLSGSNKLLPETFKWLAPGVHRTPPTRVICGYSVGPVKQCAFSPAKAPDQQPTARPTAPPTP